MKFNVVESKKHHKSSTRNVVLADPVYEDPVNGTCKGKGEIVAEVSGVNGVFCSPSCKTSDCPDAPAGVTALPECALQPQGASEPTNCALACGGAAVCPDGAKCTTVVPGSMFAVCMYPEAESVEVELV